MVIVSELSLDLADDSHGIELFGYDALADG